MPDIDPDLADDNVFDRGPVYIDDDGAVIYRASALGRCIGSLVRARLGVTPSPPPADMQARFDEGHDWEERVILGGLGVDWTRLDERKLKHYGTVVKDPSTGNAQVETEIRFGKQQTYVVRCHPDAIVQHGSRYVHETSTRADGRPASFDIAGNAERRVVEAKFFGTDLFYATVKDGLGFAYDMQLSVEMHSTGLPALYVIGLKERAADTGELSLGEIWTQEIDDPPFTLAQIKARVLEVEGWVARGEMPDCPRPLDYPCPFWQEHEHWDGPVEVDDDELTALLARWERVKQDESAVKGIVDDLRPKIHARLVELNRGDKVKCAGWVVSKTAARPGNVSWSKAWKSLGVEVTRGVDVDKFRGAGIEESVKLEKA